MTSALYLFCLAREGLVPRLESNGINGDETLLMKDFADVTAIVCETSGGEFSGPEAERRLQDLEWVAPRAVRHERVIEEVMRYSPVLPARFGSLFSSRESLVRLVEANLATISEFLDHVSDKEEWSVKGYLSKAKALEDIIFGKSSAASETLSSLTPGMRYFKERQIRAEADKLAGLVRTSCSVASEGLIGCSVDSRQRKIVRLSKEENAMQLIANWAFLVDCSAAGEFRARVEKANARLNPGGVFFEILRSLATLQFLSFSRHGAGCMKYLVYCIFSGNKGAQESHAPIGIGGSLTYVVENNGLGAAISAIPDDQVMKDSATILTYHKVVESFHKEYGAIPLRFGTIIDDEAEIGRVLEKHGERYKSLLNQLEDRVEMGIRIITSNLSTEPDSDNERPIFHGTNSAKSGAAYLACRKARLDALQLTEKHNQYIIAKYRAPFEGLFVKFKGEARKSATSVTGSDAVVLSLYFLIPGQSVAAFREVYDRLMSSEPAKTMLSGPWPPYNFVLPDDF